MSEVQTCSQCCGSDIETDSARGDSVCTNCGYVVESSIIISEVTFQEDCHGKISASGQYVSSGSKGGGGIVMGRNGFPIRDGFRRESRELTLRKAMLKIREVAQILRLNQHCTDVAFNFFRLALNKELTQGRKIELTIAACVYMTCRTEKTSHLLIDLSDVFQIDVYTLGRAYLYLSRSLSIDTKSIPFMDPCLYIHRFVHNFGLGDKAHEVGRTAQMIVKRMQKDWLDLGRHPSGICGAAMLIAARLHNFSRTLDDVIKVVQVHKTTIKKRLVEFGETPSSALTFDEFTSVVLEAEQDPPSFTAARARDRQQLQKQLIDEGVSNEFCEIRKRIDEELDKRRTKAQEQRKRLLSSNGAKKSPPESEDISRFIVESTISTISNLMEEESSNAAESLSGVSLLPVGKTVSGEEESSEKCGDLEMENFSSRLKPESVTTFCLFNSDKVLMPPPALATTLIQITQDVVEDSSDELAHVPASRWVPEGLGGDDLSEGIDDDEINGYLMTDYEVESKTLLWETLYADYIREQELKNDPTSEEYKKAELKEQKKVQRKTMKSASTYYQARSASEAIKIMLKNRKMSSKINYEVLKTLCSNPDDDLFGHVSVGSPAPEASCKRKNDKKASTALATVIKPGSIVPTSRNIKRNHSSDDTEPLVPETNWDTYPEKRVKIDCADVKMSPRVKSEGQDCKIKDQHGVCTLSTLPDCLIPKVEECVTECGPVSYEDGGIGDSDEEQDEDRDPDDKKLLAQIRGESDSYDFCDYY